MLKKTVVSALFILCCCLSLSAQNIHRWSEKKAARWYDRQPWYRGCDFIPSTAINQLEMWQADTFDPETIDRELGWAEDLGFNIMRVFLHHVAWEQDRDGFLQRMDKYLEISWSHGIKTMFVFMDDCWNPTALPGKQPEPKKGVHNSGWLQDPGDLLFRQDSDTFVEDTAAVFSLLEAYVKDVLTRFKKDKRVAVWDLYNEPGGGGVHCPYREREKKFLPKVFLWASQVRPRQPLTAGIWSGALNEYNQWQIANSDIITYHTYQPFDSHKEVVDTLSRYNRPMICTEYMARTLNSTFQSIMPMLKERKVGAINWGFVSGKTNTIFPWEAPGREDQPKLWFHDVLYPDGTPYREEEVQCIKKLTGKE